MDPLDVLHNGELYDSLGPEILDIQIPCQELLWEFNQTPPSQPERRQELMKQMFAEIGEGVWIEAPMHANWGCHFVHFGDNVFANYNLTLVDDTHIYVGDETMFGPNVTISTAGHPIHAALREYPPLQFNAPVHIGKRCWIGANASIMPGVTIGDNTVIGAGSVVTKDIPANVVAYGVPCRVVREIGERDREVYFRDKQVDWEALGRTPE